MQFHAIASTGRTATTFLARALDSLAGVAACHEGYRAADKDSEPLLPLINLENRQAFYSAEKAREIVAAKRSDTVLGPLAERLDFEALVDVAYYNPVIAEALLEAHPEMRLVAIIRELEPFVRSATAMEGEDLLPVGWPDPGKPLTARERFIEMGRIKPAKGSREAEEWDGWSAIARNIWLWRETNALLLQARAKFGERVLLLPFEGLSADPEGFLSNIADHFGFPQQGIPAALEAAKGHRNRKASGYQVGPLAEWTANEQALAHEAQTEIGSLA